MARWTDLAQWRGPTVNEGDGDSNPNEPADRMYEYRGIVVHIAVGYYEGTISWQRNPDANVSSHFVVGRAGQTAQVVDTAIRAWTQSAGNGYWLSVENEGFLLGDRRWKDGWHLLSPAMIEANAQLLARAHREYGVPLQLAGSPTGRGLGYHSMGAENGYNWGHSACPGEPIKAQLPQVVARAIEIVGGSDMSVEEKLHDVVVTGGTEMGRKNPAPFRATSEGNGLCDKLDAIWGEVEALSLGGIDLDALAAKVAALVPKPPTAEEVAAAVLSKKGELAKAVLDEDHARTAD